VADDLELARHAALRGAAVAMGYFAALAGLRHERKVDGSVVTEADRVVEQTIRDELAAARPGDTVLGEEGGEQAGREGSGAGGERAGGWGSGPNGSGRRRWIVDPIDGTALFVAGDDRWLVLLALEEDGEIVAGVAVVPAQGRIWWAERGAGAHEAPFGAGGIGAARRISVAGQRPDGLAGSRLGVVPALDDPAGGGNVVPAAPQVVGALADVARPRPWALHPPLAVARGDLDLAVQTSGHVWDFAATSLIVAEAGGCYRGPGGRRQPGPGPSVFARDADLAEAALRMLGPGQR
jgi:histidinol-phosphatase